VGGETGLWGLCGGREFDDILVIGCFYHDFQPLIASWAM
jgi:hypothetical protein